MFNRVAVWPSEPALEMKRRLWVLGFILLGHTCNRATLQVTQDINTFCTCEGVSRGEWAMGEDTHWMWVALFCRLVVQNGTKAGTPVEALSPSCWPWGEKALPPHTWTTTRSPEVHGANQPMTGASEPVSLSTLFLPSGFFPSGIWSEQ